jgi:hypothetical protein
MKAVTFESTLRDDRALSVPESVLDKIPSGQPLRVVILLPEGSEDESWEQLAAAEFGMGYADSDAIYDQLSPR